MIRHIFRFLARLVTTRQAPDPPGLPTAEAAQLRQAMHQSMHHAGPVIDDPGDMHWMIYGN